MGDATAKALLHNRVAAEGVRAIVYPVIQAGGTPSEIMIVAESVLAGIALACIKLGGDDLVLDIMLERARERLAQIRLADFPTAGQA